MTVHQTNGSVHGFVELRSEDGAVVAAGDSTRVYAGDHVTSRTTFHFKDGSIDDETTIFSQHRVLQLISDHHIQKGPSFPHPMDMMIDARSGQVTVRTEKDGKEDVKTEHMKLPPDLANGIVPIILENLRTTTGDSVVPMIIATPKPMLVKLVITRVSEDNYTLGGETHKANRYRVKIDLSGLAAIVAPLIGKSPPDIQIWTVGGAATTFAREVGPLYADGPTMTIQLTSPAWPDEGKH